MPPSEKQHYELAEPSENSSVQCIGQRVSFFNRNAAHFLIDMCTRIFLQPNFAISGASVCVGRFPWKTRVAEGKNIAPGRPQPGPGQTDGKSPVLDFFPGAVRPPARGLRQNPRSRPSHPAARLGGRREKHKKRHFPVSGGGPRGEPAFRRASAVRRSELTCQSSSGPRDVRPGSAPGGRGAGPGRIGDAIPQFNVIFKPRSGVLRESDPHKPKSPISGKFFRLLHISGRDFPRSACGDQDRGAKPQLTGSA